MGQYYKALVVKETRIRTANKYGCMTPPRVSAYSLESKDYNGLCLNKLMEWAYIGNVLACTVTSQFVRPLTDKRKRFLAVVGDYSGWADQQVPKDLEDYRYEFKDAHDAVWNKYGNKALRKKNAFKVDLTGAYYCNRTLKEYVDPSKCPCDMNGFIVHPLMVLCATSNGRGNGDYSGNNEDMAGRWAWCDIAVTPTRPEGYTEVEPGFME